MSTLSNTSRDAEKGEFDGREPDVDRVNSVSASRCLTQESRIRPRGQSRFEGKALPALVELPDATQHESPGTEGALLGSKG